MKKYPRSLHLTVLAEIALLATLGLCNQSVLAQNLPPGDQPPPTAIDLVENAGDKEMYEGSSYVVIQEASVNRVKSSGVTEVDKYMLYKMLNRKGCRDFSVMNWGYDPRSSYVVIYEINIIRDGKKIQVDVSTIKDVPAPQRAIYWGNRLKMIQLPLLHVNDGIEVRTSHKGYNYALLEEASSGSISIDDLPDEPYIPPMAGHYFDIVTFESSVPVLEKKYVLALPSDKNLHSKVYNGALYSSTSYTADTTYYSWWGLDLQPIKSERFRPSGSDYITKVVMSTAESWEAKSKWFYDVNENQFIVTPAIQSQVDNILSASGVKRGSEEEKAAVLLHWVAQNIRYSGQSMGEGEGFTLHPGNLIFKNRSGVCKDIAGMLITMMRAAGMDSYAAMTMAGSRIEDLPADQFNHCVVALKKSDGRFEMYDPTWAPYNTSIWSLLEAEQHYLIGTPSGEYLNRIDYSSPDESPLKMKNIASLSTDGTLTGKLTLKGDGAVDSRLRRMVSSRSKASLESYLCSLFDKVNQAVIIKKYDHGNVNDFQNTMWWEIEYVLPEYAFDVDNGLEFKSPMLNLALTNGHFFRLANYELPKERDADMFLYFTQAITIEEEISLPGKYKLSGETIDSKIEDTYAYFDGTVSLSRRKLSIIQRLELRRRQIPPDNYSGFRDVIVKAQENADAVYRLERSR